MPTPNELQQAVLTALLDRAAQGGADALADMGRIEALAADPDKLSSLFGNAPAAQKSVADWDRHFARHGMVKDWDDVKARHKGDRARLGWAKVLELNRRVATGTSRQSVRKSAGPVAAGLAVVADDTGRLLLIQRKRDDDQGGKWEFPGGKRAGDEHTLETAAREWTEEVGLSLPSGSLDGNRHWLSGDGKYQGYVYRVPSEGDLDLTCRDEDGDGSGWAAVAWVDPGHFAEHNLRDELKTDVDDVLTRVVKYLAGARMVRKDQKG